MAMRRGSLSPVLCFGGLPGRLCDAVLSVLFAATPDVGGAYPARRGVRVSVQDRADAVDLGLWLCRRIARRRLRPGYDRRRPCRGAPDVRRPLHRRRVWLVQALCNIV